MGHPASIPAVGARPPGRRLPQTGSTGRICTPRPEFPNSDSREGPWKSLSSIRSQNRTCASSILRVKCGLSITPRMLRRTGATLWPGDLKDLQLQGGWKDAKTPLEHYKQGQAKAHREVFDVLFGRQDRESDDMAYG